MARPTKYKIEMLPRILKLMREGASKVEVCADLDISTETLAQWQKPSSDYYIKEFSDTIKRGELLSNAWWERNGRVNLYNKDFSAVLFYMNMKNRFGWRDKQELSSDKEAPLIINITKGDDKL